VRSCVFTSNYAEGAGGAIHTEHRADPTFVTCTFVANSSRSWGGAVHCDGASACFVDCHFEGNASGEFPAAIMLWDAAATLEGCTLVNHTPGCLSGHMESQISATNCTFWGNGTTEGGGSAVHVVWGSRATLQNSILSHSVAGPAVGCFEGASLTLSCSDIFGNEGGDWTPCVEGQSGVNGNIAKDPMYCNSAEGVFLLQPDSPCSPDSSFCGRIGAWPVGYE
jgi:predicted outer membrane repeat protein